jgi:hypothetical protein
MRHVWSLLAGIVVTPLAWVLIAFGQAATISGSAAFSPDPSTRLAAGGGLLIVAGLLVGLIGSLRVSPVGALIPAIVFLGASVYSWIDPLRAGFRLNQIHWSVAGVPLDLFGPVYTGVLPVLGSLLTVCAFSAQRWRRWPRPGAAVEAAEGDPDTSFQHTSDPDVYDRLLGQPSSPAMTPDDATPAESSGADAPSWPQPSSHQ